MRVRPISTADLLGVRISTLSFGATMDLIAGTILGGERLAVSPSPAYTVMLGRERSEVRAALNANLATPDGMGVVWALQKRGHPVERVYGPDLLLAACQRGLADGWRHYFYGGAEGVAKAMADRLAARFPGLIVAGTFCPPFRSLSNEETTREIAIINEAEADIVWVGLGSPKQDLWMAERRARLTAPVLVGVGAAFDFLARRVRQAPRWIQRTGLEWAFRLMVEPRRLWRRYLLYNPRFAWAVLTEKRQRFSKISRPSLP